MTNNRKEPPGLKKKSEPKDTVRLFGVVDVDAFLLSPLFQRWALNVIVSMVLATIFLYKVGEDESKRVYKAGDIALEDIYANKELLIPDQETTEQRRKKAEKSVYPVFDYDPRLARDAEVKARKVFADLRGLYQPEWDWNDAEKNRLDILRKEFNRRREKPVPYIQDENFQDKEDELKNKFFNLPKDVGASQTQFNDKQFASLKQEHFSEDIENKIVELLLKVMGDGIVANKDNLPKPGQTITVRVLPFNDSSKQEYPAGDISSMKGIDEAMDSLNGLARDQWSREIPRNLRYLVVDIAQALIRPNYSFNPAATAEKLRNARDNVEQAYIRIKKGEKIIGQGEIISPDHLKKLELITKQESSAPYFVALAGNFLWISIFLAIIYAFPARTIRKFKPSVKDLIHLGSLLILLLGILKIALTLISRLETGDILKITYIVPLVTGAMMIRLLISSEVAVVFSVALALLAGMMAGSPSFAMFILVGSLIGANEVGQARTRTSIAKAGFYTGMANIFLVLTLSLRSGTFLETANFYNAVMGFSAGILASFLVLALMPIAELIFGYVTDIRLLEIASQEHPLLKALIMNAPGTYQHALMVGTLAEAAAESIHVNPLLAKVMALYHDIGKMEKPTYFVENQRDGINRHDKLAPSMSSLIISSHVKYGMELAKMYRLPQNIIDAIPQHHGTSLMKYFYARAKEREDPELQHVEEKDFRYPGPKPQTREAGILMLADSVEATARSLPDPTPAKLKGMVRRIIGGIFNDGQLDECELTLKDLNAIAEAFTDVLTSIYHSRPEYPPQPAGKRPGAANGGKKDGGGNTPGQQNDESGPEGKDEDQKPTRKNPIHSPV